MTQKVKLKTCSKCGSTNLVTDFDAGEEVCANCGLVITEGFLNSGPEWRAFSNSEKMERSRASSVMSFSLYDKGFSTGFNLSRDGLGNQLNIETRQRMNRLRKYNTRSKMDDTWGRNLSIAMAELDRLTARLHIPPSLKEQSAIIYRRALKEDLIRGRSIDAFVAASIYAGCRTNGVPRSLKSISTESSRDHSEIARSYRILIRDLKIKMPIDDPIKFVSGIAAKLKLKRATEFHAIDILREARKKRELTGKDPRGVAAAALYMACLANRERRIQKEIATAAGTTEVTLRNRLRGLEKALNKVSTKKIQ